MRLPRVRLKLRGMMLVVALIGVVFAGLAGVRTERARRNHQASVERFAELEDSARRMEKLYRDLERLEEQSVAEAAQSAASQLRLFWAVNNRTRYAARSPGSSGGYDDPIDGIADSLIQMRLKSTIEQGKWSGRRVAQHRAAAALAGKRAKYFSQMRQKYAGAVSHPWFTVELDPPVPE